MAHKLFILVSADLREYLSLGDNKFEVLVLPEGRMTAEKEPAHDAQDLWDKELKPLILERIQDHNEWKESKVRFAGHVRACFGDQANMGQDDQRFPEIEQNLVAALGHQIDIQVFGFHHENWSEIWKVASKVRNFLGDPGKEGQFLLDLEQAFVRSAKQYEAAQPREQQDRFAERFAIARHDILRLLGPLQMRLENARDARPENPGWADEIEASVGSSIEPAIIAARRLWKECAGMVAEGEPKKMFDAVFKQLEIKPNAKAADFRAWLDILYDRLSKF